MRVVKRTPKPQPPRVVYTDGALSKGNGGWAWATAPRGELRGSGRARKTTNQRMELQAAYEAVKALPGPLVVVSDSAYVVNCFKDKWYLGWKRRNWTGSQGKAVANQDIWEPFIELVLSRGDVTFKWVKGHSGNAMNDLVDALAVAERKKLAQ